jgi:hypothetical protein
VKCPAETTRDYYGKTRISGQVAGKANVITKQCEEFAESLPDQTEGWIEVGRECIADLSYCTGVVVFGSYEIYRK